MINVFTDKKYTTEQNRKIVFPLLFDLLYTKNKTLLTKYQIVDEIQNADIVIIPIDIGYYFKNKKEKELYSLIDEALHLNKKVWVYTAGDFGLTIYKDVYTFRLGGFDSKLNSKTLIMPSFINSPYILLGNEFKPIPKSDLPEISFVGHANNSFYGMFKEFMVYVLLNTRRIFKKDFFDYEPFFPSGKKRFQFLNALQKEEKIKTQFVFRKKYRAGVRTEAERNKTTLEFLKNMYNSPYVFCMRGGGNFSVRFYEAIAMGRIPLVVDTDCRWPLPQKILWSNHCVIANEHDFVNKLVDFHKNCTAKEFEDIQRQNRQLWLNFLTREGYFLQVYSLFKENSQ